MSSFYTEKQCRSNLDNLANWLLSLDSLPNKYERIVTVDLFDTKTSPFVTLWKVEEATFNTNASNSIIDYTYLANPQLIALEVWKWNDVARLVYGITDGPAMLLLFNNKWVNDLSPKFAGKVIKFYLAIPTEVWRNHNHAIYPNIVDIVDKWWVDKNALKLNKVNLLNVVKYIEGKNKKDYMVFFSDKTDILITKVTSDNASPYFTTNETINEQQISAINDYFNIKFK